MNRLSLSLLFCIFFGVVRAQRLFQKPMIDSGAYKHWASVDDPAITNDGKYMRYVVRNERDREDATIIRECEGNWSMTIPLVYNVMFSSDSRRAVFLRKDSLNIIDLDKKTITGIPGVRSFMLPSSGNGAWIAYGTTSKGELVLRNITLNRIRKYECVQKYSFSEDGKYLMVEFCDKMDSRKASLVRIEMEAGKSREIWGGAGMLRWVCDISSSRFAILTAQENSERKSIWFCRVGTDNPIPLLTKFGSDTTYQIDDLKSISNDGDFLLLSIRKVERNSSEELHKSVVRIWSYLDERLLSSQLSEINNPSKFTFAVRISDERIYKVAEQRDLILGSSSKGDRYLIRHMSGNGEELDFKWSSAAQKSYYLRSFESDSTTHLKFNNSKWIGISPSGRFVLSYDLERNGYFSYEVSSGIYRNITYGIKTEWTDYYRKDMKEDPRGTIAWTANDKYVLIYDRFDIWLVDPMGKSPALNLTNYFGKKNQIILNLALELKPKCLLAIGDTLILNGLDIVNKKNGYFVAAINKPKDPILMSMDDCIYQLIGNPYVDNQGKYPVKARDRNKYIVMRMKANESPNYFFTRDFSTFVRMSDIRPEAYFNWYTTELHNWTDSNGKQLQGILYKPENFDNSRKYPVIFYYYEKKSFSLNEYLRPESISGGCNLNIPSFVSKGYLVFTPDIEYKIGDPMKGTLDVLVSAARHLAGFSFVDSTRMGIGGCSFGGVQTNYLITHTNMFAAAYSSSSMSDLISAYGEITKGGESLHHFFEMGQLRMGGTLWQRPDSYIKSSAVLNADKVNTPLLLMHTTNDDISSFSQAIEFYTALRRLGKRVWLLEYLDANHAIFGRSAEDFGVRLNQFFDHYLKGAPIPQWMSNGTLFNIEEAKVSHKVDYSSKILNKVLTDDSAYHRIGL